MRLRRYLSRAFATSPPTTLTRLPVLPQAWQAARASHSQIASRSHFAQRLPEAASAPHALHFRAIRPPAIRGKAWRQSGQLWPLVRSALSAAASARARAFNVFRVGRASASLERFTRL